MAVTFQDGREHTVDQVVLFLYPTGTGVAEERQQIGVRRIRDGRTFALFRWQIPASLYSHLEVQLECGDGQTISVSQWNVIANLPNGATVTIYGEWNGWYVVHYGDQVGYAAAAYINT